MLNQLKITILFIALMTFVISCQNEPFASEKADILGVWHLVNMKPVLGEGVCNFDKGLIVWTFDESIMSIEDNSTDLNNSCFQYPNWSDQYDINAITGRKNLYLDDSTTVIGFRTIGAISRLNEKEMNIIQNRIQA